MCATSLSQMAAAIEAAELASPRPPDGEYAETWDGGKSFHWSGKEKTPIAKDSERHKVEAKLMELVVALDKKQKAQHRRPKCMASHRGVRVGWLKQEFVRELEKKFGQEAARTMTTLEVMLGFIKPQTSSRRCRFVETMLESNVGETDLFASVRASAPLLLLPALSSLSPLTIF